MTSKSLKSGKLDQPPAQRDVSIQAQLEANDVPEFANEPGPGHYFGPENHGFSSLGPQKFSKSASAPEVTFPTTGWQEWKKVIISKGHEGAYKLRDSPGCAYFETDKGDAPLDFLDKKTCVIGTGQRPDLSMSLGMNPDGSPGPKYNVREAKAHKGTPFNDMRRQTDRFDTGHKFQGPGPYSRKDVALNPATGRSFGVGRAAWDKVIRPGWEKDGQCKTSTKIGCPLWNDPAKNPCSGAYSIGNAPRFPKDRVSAASPGPGQYKRDEKDMSRCKSVCSDTRNASGAPFGRRLPRKPRFRMMLALNTAKHGGWGYF